MFFVYNECCLCQALSSLVQLRLKSAQLIANQIWEFCCSYDYDDNNNNNNNNNKEGALRAAYCDNQATYEELLHRAKLPTLYTRRLQAIAIIMYKVKNGLGPVA